jgi:molybdate transport system substrate-binding protein
MRWGWASIALAVAVVVGGATGCESERQAALPALWAASSMSGVLDEMLLGECTFTFGASATLARQIIAGAGAELYVSADPVWVDELDRHGLVAGRRTLCANTLVLVAAAGVAPVRFATLADSRGRIALGDPGFVPAGRYARAALEAAGIWERVRERVVPAGDVRAALAYVERGACDYGIVYRTDALLAPGVHVLESVPDSLTPPIRYELALLQDARPGAVALFARLTSAGARAALGRYGFQTGADHE